MKRICGWIGGGLTVLALAGCQPAATPPPPAATNAPAPGAAAPAPLVAVVDPRIPTQAQGRLQTLKLWVGPKPMVAELALTPLQQQTGMMFRTNMDENEGMLFPSAYPEQKSFWMMNTRVPLSLAYIDPNGAILEIHDLQPFDTNSVPSASANVQYVLETPQGWFQKNGVGPGMVVSSEHGPFAKVFFPIKR